MCSTLPHVDHYLINFIVLWTEILLMRVKLFHVEFAIAEDTAFAHLRAWTFEQRLLGEGTLAWTAILTGFVSAKLADHQFLVLASDTTHAAWALTFSLGVSCQAVISDRARLDEIKDRVIADEAVLHTPQSDHCTRRIRLAKVIFELARFLVESLISYTSAHRSFSKASYRRRFRAAFVTRRVRVIWSVAYHTLIRLLWLFLCEAWSSLVRTLRSSCQHYCRLSDSARLPGLW